MFKAMLFVDADWLCASTLDSAASHGKPDPQIDFRRLSGVLADEISRRNHISAIEVVRSQYFASLPNDFDERDHTLVQRRREFIAKVEEEPRVDLEVVDVDDRRRSIGRDEGWPPAGAPGVHVALTVAAMRYALTPGVLDLAIFVLGERSFAPLLRELRRLGRQVALVSVEGHCAPDLADPAHPIRVSDFEVVWLNELIGRVERWRGRRPFRPGAEAAAASEEAAGASLRGRIKNVIWDRGYGFIAAEDGRDYFFHINALEAGLEFDALQPDLTVSFEVKSGPLRGRAGAARLVRLDPSADQAAPPSTPDQEDAELPAPGQPLADPAARPEPDQGDAAAPLPEQPTADPADEGGALELPPDDETLAPTDTDAEEPRS